MHHVDSPAYDRHGNLYVTFSGSRGQQAPVAIFIVRPDGTREPFVSDVPNPTSLAFDRDGRLYVSSRFDGSVYRVEADGRATLYASDLGVACGLAFGPDGALFVGDRSGSVLRVEATAARTRSRRCRRAWPRSISRSARTGYLYVAAPTLGTHDPIYRISPDGEASAWSSGFGRPQGLAFDAARPSLRRRRARGIERALSHPAGRAARAGADALGRPLIGLAFDPHGGIALATSETVYRLGVAAARAAALS